LDRIKNTTETDDEMQRSIVLFLASVLIAPCALLAQQSANPTTNGPDGPRVYVTDSNSWSVRGSAGAANGVFAASSSGGAQPQTAEIIKTFGQRCPQVTVNNRLDVSNYIVELDHDGARGVLSHRDKIAVFVQKTGDSIFSKSTMSVGGSVQDACEAILAHWAQHSAELRVALVAAPASATEPTAQTVSIAVDASAPNCDIEIDGNFVGNTPSTVSLAPGKHDVAVKKSGYQDWKRTINVTGGSVHVSADMVTK
jgi:hypothetical protein